MGSWTAASLALLAVTGLTASGSMSLRAQRSNPFLLANQSLMDRRIAALLAMKDLLRPSLINFIKPTVCPSRKLVDAIDLAALRQHRGGLILQYGAWSCTFVLHSLNHLINVGCNQANLGAARVGLDIAIAQSEKTMQNAFRALADSLAQGNGSRLSKLRLCPDHGAASKQAVINVQRAFVQGPSAINQVLGDSTREP